MMLANSSPASTPSQLELSIRLCSSKKPTLGGSKGAVQERLVRRTGSRPNYTNLVHERLHYRLGSQVYTHLNDMTSPFILIVYSVGFEVLTAVVIKSSFLWDITPCRPLKVNRCFGKNFFRIQE
jgi:hypothetical protein